MHDLLSNKSATNQCEVVEFVSKAPSLYWPTRTPFSVLLSHRYAMRSVVSRQYSGLLAALSQPHNSLYPVSTRKHTWSKRIQYTRARRVL